jgi:hypothetical protein
MQLHPEPISRRKLTPHHIFILHRIYIYRFTTRQLILNKLTLKHPSSLHRTLETLIAQDYVGKRYEKSYRLQGKPAVYYIKSKAIRYLAALPPYSTVINDKIIKASYRDTQATDEYVDHVIQAITYIQLVQAQYDPKLLIKGKRELRMFNFMPRQLPDAMLVFRHSKTQSRFFFFDYIPATMPRYLIRRKLKDYEAYFQSGDWTSAVSDPEPILLFCTDTPAAEKRLTRIVGQFNERNYTSYVIYVANAAQFIDPKKRKIWTRVETEPGEYFIPAPVTLTTASRSGQP